MEALIVPGNLDSLTVIGKYIMTAAEAAGLEKKAAYRLRLAVDEIATNIVNYGYDAAGITGNIDVHAAIDATTLSIVVEDSANPFDPSKHEMPDDMDKPLEERQIGGLGIFLAIKGVDIFTYERIGDRNRNTFVMYRSTPEQR